MNSIKPWHTKHTNSDVLVLDALGKVIGNFKDHADADAAVKAFNSWGGTPEIEKLQDEIEELNDKIGSLETKVEDLDDENDDLEKQVESLEEKLSLVRDAIQ
jgi:peptidoglycan hydrolase CwlO-like protein